MSDVLRVGKTLRRDSSANPYKIRVTARLVFSAIRKIFFKKILTLWNPLAIRVCWRSPLEPAYHTGLREIGFPLTFSVLL
jgi:hypothetical protein